MQTLFFEKALLPGGWAHNVALRVENGFITEVAPGVSPVGMSRDGGIALPGLASLHSHTFQRGMAGLGEIRGPSSDSFWSWRQVMYHFLGALSADDVEAIAAFAFMEMLEGGFTAVGEFHYLHHAIGGAPYANPAEHCERIAAAAAETGIGLTLLPVFYAQGGFGGLPPTEGQRRFICDLDGFARLHEKARAAITGLADAAIGVAPHSLRAVTPETLDDLLATHKRGPIHIHIAEQLREVEDCIGWSGRRPVEWLFDHAEVDARWCLIHATHMTEAEGRSVAASGAVAGLCPITEANLGDGIFDAPTMLAAGGAFGVGTDSNVEITAAGELKQLEYSQRLGLRARNVFPQHEGHSTGAALYHGALAGGAQALGRKIGGIAPGNRADFVVLDATHSDLAHGVDDGILDRYIFVAGARAIDAVYVGGIRQVTGGRHVAREAIAARYGKVMARLAAL
ncbi:MAG: formiminoglutamate [Beijerinckiaceae bacterium]|nr:MAG: formiminoglutamate [Beijerinckiaceae bacterium]